MRVGAGILRVRASRVVQRGGRRMLRRLNLAALLALGTLWAGLLVVGGLALASREWVPGPAATGAGLAGGLTAIAAGQFVFLVVVGDRLFPGASRTVVTVTELALGLMFLLGAAWTAVSLALGAST